MTTHKVSLEMDPKTCGGRPVIDGTRLEPLQFADKLRDGVTLKEIREGWPGRFSEDELKFIRALADWKDRK
jgi:uncharacterized protein (DUF433 family)